MRTVCLCYLLLAGVILAESDTNRVRVSIELPSAETVLVGQQVLIPITLFLAERQRGSPTFRLPAVPGGALVQISGSPTFGTEELDGISFATWTYTLGFYAQRAGEHPVGSIEVSVEQPEGGGVWKPLSVQTKPCVLQSRLPEGASRDLPLVTSDAFELTETWEPERETFRVGDAVTRTVALKGENVLAMGLPPVRFVTPYGLAAYSQKPHLEETSNRGDVSGARRDSVVYVCEQAGHFVLPEIRMQWYQPNANLLRVLVLPERVLEVQAAPSAATEDTEVSPSASWEGRGILLLGMGGVTLAGLFLLLWLIMKPYVRRYQNRPRCLPPLNPNHD